MNAATSLTAYRRREKQRQILRHVALVLVGVLLLWVVVLFVWRGVTIAQMKAEISRLDHEIEKTQLDRQALQALLARTNDARLIERQARWELGLVKKGEVKMILCLEGAPRVSDACPVPESK
jgi:cell division protein FtsB